MEHELLSERRFFGEFLGLPEGRRRMKSGGSLSFRSLTWSGRGSGSSGGACCTPRIIVLNSEFIYACWTRVCRQRTVQLPTFVGKVLIQRRLSPLQTESKEVENKYRIREVISEWQDTVRKPVRKSNEPCMK